MTSKVTIEDVRLAGLCIPGARLWARRHGIDWHAFLRDGIDEQKLLETGDAMAARAVEQARARSGNG